MKPLLGIFAPREVPLDDDHILIQTSELTPQETAYGIMESARVFFIEDEAVG